MLLVARPGRIKRSIYRKSAGLRSRLSNKAHRIGFNANGANQRTGKADRTHQEDLRDGWPRGEVRPRTSRPRDVPGRRGGQGETRETRLTFDGLVYLRRLL